MSSIVDEAWFHTLLKILNPKISFHDLTKNAVHGTHSQNKGCPALHAPARQSMQARVLNLLAHCALT